MSRCKPGPSGECFVKEDSGDEDRQRTGTATGINQYGCLAIIEQKGTGPDRIQSAKGMDDQRVRHRCVRTRPLRERWHPAR